MDSIESIYRDPGFPHRTSATNRLRHRSSDLRLECLENRVVLSVSPTTQVAGALPVADVGAFVSGGMLTLAGSSIQVKSAQPGVAIISGGPISVVDSALPSNSASGVAVSASSGTTGGAVSTTANPTTSSAGYTTNSAGNLTTSAGNLTTSAGNVPTSAGNPTNSAGNPTSSPGNVTTSANKTTSAAIPGTTTNSTLAPNAGYNGGGIPVATGVLTLVYGTAAYSPAASGGFTAAHPPVPPPVNALVPGSFVDHAGALPGLNVSSSILNSTVSATNVAPNPQSASPLAKAGDLVAVAVSSVSPSSTLMGTVGSGGLVYGQSGNPAGGPNLSSSATPANIGNPAPNTVFLDPDALVSKPQIITPEQSPATVEFSRARVPDAIDVPAPAEATEKRGADVELLPVDQGQGVPAAISNSMIIDSAAGAGAGLAETGLLTIGDSVLLDNLPADGGASSIGNVGEAIIVSSMLAPAIANLAFAGAISNHRTISSSTPPWKGVRRSSPMFRSRRPT
jgi:hypothetical protein